MKSRTVRALMATTILTASGILFPAHAADKALTVQIDKDDIGGVVTGSKGPEAGVWVIAETKDLSTRFLKIVVTNDRGQYVLPDLPQATYKIWARGYGLKDSKAAKSVPGKTVNLSAEVAPNDRAAAEIYPANYWLSLMKVPAESEFPGTGPQGNGIAPSMVNQQDWIAHLKEQCQFCHQLGVKATRETPEGLNSVEVWDQRVQRQRAGDDAIHENVPNYGKKGAVFGTTMNNNMTRFGRRRGLQMFADWTDGIAKGDVPKAPERPEGVERNVVITSWDIGDGRFIHDSSVSYKLDPTVGGNGPVYAVTQWAGKVLALDPKTSKQDEFDIVNLAGAWNPNASGHTSAIDAKGRYWMSVQTPDGPNPAFCTDPSASPYAKYFPRPREKGLTIGVFDPKSKKTEVIPVCYSTHHLNFTTDGNRLYHSGDVQALGWFDTKTWDATRDASKAVGWCPMVLDTNGDGKIAPDRTQWNELKEGGSAGGEGAIPGARDTVRRDNRDSLDPKKDTRITGFPYGMGVNYQDNSFWVAKFTPSLPSGIVRLDPGSNPPETCISEYYEPPKENGKWLAYNARGVDVDAKGIAWVAFGTGQIGAFDRTKCKVKNGPTATGPHCPEGWTIYETPGPKLAGTNVGSDWFYQTYVDHHDTSGLGAGTPIFPGSSSDELLAFLPESKEFVQLRVPYPLGFYPRGVDGRIDDPKAGWKGRGLWATNNILTMWHQEEGEGSTETMVKFQVRPDPLAH
jgi:hypothetical protein